MQKKFVFMLSHVTSKPIEVLGMMKIASNMKAFDDSCDVAIFLIGEGVQLAKKGLIDTLSIEFEGKQVNFGEMLEMLIELGAKFYVCHAFMPGYGVAEADLIEGAQMKSSSYLGELLLQGYVPLTLNI
ncbi:MAG: hypothetical protein OHK006_15170 [Thermodesulfovibrionales bacterium]